MCKGSKPADQLSHPQLFHPATSITNRMFRAIIAFALLVAVSAFGPAGRVSTRSAMKMELYDNAKGLVGTDIEFPEFDPLGFTKNATPEQLTWYRMAELKHGRICMLAALGQIVQYFHHPVFPETINGDKPFAAAATVFNERPLAAAQILLAIFAVEALGQFNQVKEGREPGDLDFDPLGLKPSDPELLEKVQLRELKNGRLAMLAASGMLLQEFQNGVGVLEAWKIGAINPFK
jgi:Chlorophyll A-B binding protein